MKTAIRFISAVLCLVCIFSTVGCVSDEPQPETSVSETALTVTTRPGTAKFLTTSQVSKLYVKPFKDFEYCVWLYAVQGFAFLRLNEYLFRYNLEKQAFDKSINLGDIESEYDFKTTYSNDGQYVISFEYDHKNHTVGGDRLDGANFTLIDLKSETSVLFAEKHDEALDDAVRAIIPSDATRYYDFEFMNDVYKTDLLAKSKLFDSYRRANKIISFSAASDQTVYILTRDKVSDYVKLGDLRLVAIDLKADKIIDDCYIIEK